MHADDREKKKHNGKEGRGQQFPSINSSSVLTVCAEQRAAQRDSSAYLTSQSIQPACKQTLWRLFS